VALRHDAACPVCRLFDCTKTPATLYRLPERHRGIGCLAAVFALLGSCLIGCPRLAPAAGEGTPQRLPVDLMIEGGTVVTMDSERRIIENGALAVRGDTILAVGPRAELARQYVPGRRIDARDKLILPGLINGHTHAPMVLFRGLGDDLPLHDWLEQYIFPAEARNVNEEFVTWGTQLAALEMIKSGTTTYADIYYFEDAIARATRDAGLRGVLGEAILDGQAPDHKTPAEALAYTERFLERWKGDRLIRPAVGPHSTYLTSEDTLRKSFALARRFGAPILIHLSETQREVDESRARHGVSPAGYLEQLGLLGPDVVAAHCTWMDGADIGLMARRGVGCVHNPSSNMMLASGVAPVVALRAAGIPVGLGTDGPAGSNNDLDLMEEMDLAAKLQKVERHDPSALNARQALEMATIDGARALHMEREIGSLEPGKKADVIQLNLSVPHAVPLYDLYGQVVYSLKSSDVETVIIDGRVVMQDRRVLTLDERAIAARARDYGERVKRSLAKP